jgi:hypothetical protein
MFDIALFLFEICAFNPNFTRVNHRLDLFDVIKNKLGDISAQRYCAESHFVQLSLQDLGDHNNISSFTVYVDWDRLI